MDYTAAINAVLRRLREDEVSAPNSSDYASYIGDLVNETKREVEDAWTWSALLQDVDVNTAASTTNYTLTGAGDRYSLNYVYNETEEYYLARRSAKEIVDLIGDGTSTGTPNWYNIKGVSSGDPQVDLAITPDGVYALKFNMYLPQADFSIGTEVFSVPSWPVVLGAYAKAIAERGENAGTAASEAQAAYMRALNDAVALDVGNSYGEGTWGL